MSDASQRLAAQATPYWDGGGSGSGWGTANNWNPNGVPANTSTVTFDADVANSKYTISLGADRTVAGIIFGATNTTNTFTLTGNTLILGTSGINNQDDRTQTINSAINLNGTQTWNMSGGGGLTVGGALTFDQNLTLSGTGAISVTGATTTSGTRTLTNNNSAGATFGNVTQGGTLNIAGTGGLTSSTGTWNINGNRTLNVTNASGLQLNNVTVGGTWTVSGTAATTVTGTTTLTGNRTINRTGAGLLTLGNVSLSNSGTNRTLTINGSNDTLITGIVSNGSSSASRLTKSGAGTLTLSGSNTYSGVTTINAGVLSVSVLANGGSASGIGNSSNAANRLVINGGTLRYTGSGHNTNRLFTIGTSGATIDASGTGALNFTNTGSLATTGTGTRTLTLTGTSTASNTFSPIIVNQSSNATSLVKNGAGTWILAGSNNTYTGSTTINGGILSVSNLANGSSASHLGQSSNAAANLVINGGTLRYTGSGASTNRNFTIGTSGATIDASGSGALNLTSTSSTTLSGTNTARTLILTGSNTGNNTYAGVLANNGTGATSLTKDGAGTWILSGNNTYTGTTTVNEGTLATSTSNRIADGSALDIGALGTFRLGGSETVSTLSGSGALNIQGNAFTTNTTANSTFSGGITGWGTVTKAGTGDLTLSGNSSYSGITNITGGTLIAAHNNALGSSAYSNTISSGATLGLQGDINLNQSGFTLAGAGDGGVGAINNISGNNTLGAQLNFADVTTIGSAADTLTLSGSFNLGYAVTMTGSGNIISSGNMYGSGSLTKEGTGTLTLSGTSANSFSGAANLNDGTIILAKTDSTNAIGQGTLNIGDGDGDDASATLRLNANNQIHDSSNVVIEDDGRFDLNGNTESIKQLSGSGQVTLGAGDLTIGTSGGGTTTYSGVISGSGNVTKISNSTLTLSGVNTYTGATNVNAGTLQLGANNALSDTTAVTVANGATFDVNDRTDTVGSIAGAGNITLGSGNLTAGGNNTDTAYSGVMSETGSFTKTGTGQLTLSGNSTYSGGTTVTGGTLLVQHNNALGANTGNVTVNSGATLALDGGLTIDKSAATLNLAGAGHNAAGALAAVGTTGTTTQWNGNLALTADATVKAADNLLILGDNYLMGTGIDLGSHTLTLDTTSATGVTPTYGLFPSYLLDETNIYVTGTITGTGGLTKTGAGTVNLISFPATGTAYTGDTVITGGKLIVDGVGEIAGYYDPTINSSNLYVGNASSPGSADSVILQMGQLASPAAPNYLIGSYDAGTNTATASMTVYEDGLFNMNGGSNRLDHLTLQGGHVTGRDLATYNPLLTIVSGVTTTASAQTAVIEELNLGMSANGFTFDIADGAATTDLRIDGILQNGVGFTAANDEESMVKTGAGTLSLTNANTYQGVTDIQQGVLNARHNTALGQYGAFGSLDNSTVVQAGAQLQLDGSAGNLAIGTETLTLNGSGIDNDGALLNLAGDNTYGGFVKLETDARINAAAGSSLTFNGPSSADTIINGSSSGRDLTLGGDGDLTFNGRIANFVDTVIKDGTGTVTLGGTTANTFTGGLTVNDGTVNLNKTAGVNAVGSATTVTVGDNLGAASSANLVYQASNQMPDSTNLVLNADGRLVMGTYTDSISTIAGTGLIDLGSTGVLTIGADDSSSVFDGTITGSGTLVKAGDGDLTLTHDISYTGTLEFGGGTLVLSGMDLTVTNLIITADTILDFSGMDSHIFATNFSFLSEDIKLNIINWTKNADGFFATNWLGATPDLVNNGGAKPMSQILFDGINPNGDPWTWSDTGWDSYNDEIYPRVPEPSTYGALLTASALLALLYRKHRQAKRGDKQP